MYNLTFYCIQEEFYNQVRQNSCSLNNIISKNNILVGLLWSIINVYSERRSIAILNYDSFKLDLEGLYITTKKRFLIFIIKLDVIVIAMIILLLKIELFNRRNVMNVYMFGDFSFRNKISTSISLIKRFCSVSQNTERPLGHQIFFKKKKNVS